jgi:hypothetical protein
MATILHPMDSKPTLPRHPATVRQAPAKPAARQEREAIALRSNLRRRKDQARARSTPQQDGAASEPAHPSLAVRQDRRREDT